MSQYGCLIRASIKLGALVAEINSEELQYLDEFAQAIGLAFQIQDDIFDADEITDNKVSYVSLLGIDKAHAKLEQLQQKAINSLQQLNHDSKLLSELTQFIMNRKN